MRKGTQRRHNRQHPPVQNAPGFTLHSLCLDYRQSANLTRLFSSSAATCQHLSIRTDGGERGGHQSGAGVMRPRDCAAPILPRSLHPCSSPPPLKFIPTSSEEPTFGRSIITSRGVAL